VKEDAEEMIIMRERSSAALAAAAAARLDHQQGFHVLEHLVFGSSVVAFATHIRI
jgi:hypothetical protein